MTVVQAPISILAALLAVLFLGRNLAGLLARDYPGLRLVFHPHSFFGRLPRLPGINIGDQFVARHRSALFSDRNPTDIISLVSFFPAARAFLVADPVAIKTILNDRVRFQKRPELDGPLGIFGVNVAVAEGEVWRRHRRVVVGSMSEDMNERAWDETKRVVGECIDEWERTNAPGVEGKREVAVANFLDLSLKVGLFVIMATSFSQKPPWRDDEPSALPVGHALPLRDAVQGVVVGSWSRLIAPSWLSKLPIPYLRRANQSYTEFELYVRQYIAEKRQLASEPHQSETGPKDLLGAMLHASADLDNEVDGTLDDDKWSEKKKDRFNDDELLASVYLFLLAGHETSANTIAFVFTLLALYPEEQERLLKHVNEVLPADPTYADFPKLTRVQAVFNETLRLFPAAVVIPKFAVSDAMIPTTPTHYSTPADNVFIPRWTDVFIDTVALHRSRKYWGKDADVFKPDRFLDAPDAPDGSYRWPRDAFLGFSGGHRPCLGQKLATVTSSAIVALLLRKYSVHLPEDLNGSGAKRAEGGETLQEKVERVTRCTSGVGLLLRESGLVFRER